MIDDLVIRGAQGVAALARVTPQVLAYAGQRGWLPDAATAAATGTSSTSSGSSAATSGQGSTQTSSSITESVATSSNAVAPSTSSTPSAAAGTGGEFPTILLTCLIWSSLAAALVLILLPDRTREQRDRIRIIALAGAALPLALAVVGLYNQYTRFQQDNPLGQYPPGHLAYEENRPWITSLPVHIDYHLAADGISLPLLLLSTVLFTVAVLASWHNERRVKLYFFLLLLLETGVNGTFAAFDYVLFFLFYEIELVPMFLLIAIWGGPRRSRAAWKFLGFTICSSALLLAAVIITVVKSGAGNADFLQVGGSSGAGIVFGYPGFFGLEQVVFWLFFAGFAIKLPVVPLHTWLPDAHTEASSPISAILAGILLKLGGYGMIRICLASFPHAAHRASLAIAIMAALSAVWGTLAALAQDDIKRLVAYGSVGHMAIVLLAVSAQSTIALNGAVLQMVAHGLSTGLLFLLAGTVQGRARTRSVRQLGGLAWQAPKLTALWVVAGLASLGLPFLAGFVAEFEVFTGAYPVHRVATVVVMASIAITTGYLLWMLERAFFGPAKEVFARVKDATTLELIYLVPLSVLLVFLGIFPGVVIPLVANGVQSVTSRLLGAA